MSKTFVKIAVSAVAASLVIVVGCGGKASQGSASSRGVLRDSEPCEQMAFGSAALRASGNAQSQNEQHGTRSATAAARAELARSLSVVVGGMDRGFGQEHARGQDGGSYVGKTTTIEEGFFEQTVSDSRVVCKNVYDLPDGRLNIYVTVELGEKEEQELFKKLKDDEKIAIDFAEHEFLQEYRKRREEFMKERGQ